MSNDHKSTKYNRLQNKAMKIVALDNQMYSVYYKPETLNLTT